MPNAKTLNCPARVQPSNMKAVELWCGLIRNPQKYLIGEFLIHPNRVPDFVETLKKGLLVGDGCTMDDPQHES